MLTLAATKMDANEKASVSERIPEVVPNSKDNSCGEAPTQESKRRVRPRRRRHRSKKNKQGQEDCEEDNGLSDEGEEVGPLDPNGVTQKSEIGRTPIASSDLKAKISRVKNKLAKFTNKCSKVDNRRPSQTTVDQKSEGKRRTCSERSASQQGAEASFIKSMLFTSSATVNNAPKSGRSVSESEPGPSRRRNTEEEDSIAKSVKKRARQKKGSTDKSLWDQFYGRKPENGNGEFRLDSLSFFLLDMLFTSAEKREQLIAREACNRGILLESNNFWHLNPKILKWNSQPFRSSYAKIAANYSDRKFAGKLFAAAPPPEEASPKTFEDLVNIVVQEGLSEDQRKEFAFPVTASTKRRKNYFKEEDFESKLEAFAQKCVEANLGVIVEEEVRISAKNNHHAFIKVTDSERDAMISTPLTRKFALQGDVVRAFVRNGFEEQTTAEETVDSPPDDQVILDSQTDDQLDVDSPPLEDTVQLPEEEPLVVGKSTKAFVIKIVKEVHNRMVVGSFLSWRKNCKFIMFVPQDMRLPNIRIFEEFWPDSFRQGNMDKVSDTLYVAEIIGWQNDVCIGRIVQSIGKCGDLDSENRAILLKNNLQLVPFDEKFNEMYSGEFTISEEELGRREDLRKECIFTIDPLTAKDLDDAMSVKQLPDGNFQIGVHISDVSYFLEEGCELDELVKMRTTSVYMVNEVFHMLPKSLCFRCSLLPGTDKLAFSVFWNMTPEAEILSTRFARTVIRSCTQFAYQHAQLIIDNPDREFSDLDFPLIHNGFTAADVVRCVRQLDSLATIMRRKRFENGALRIDRPKMSFILDPNTGAPIEVKKQEQLEANFLIEEFMLLANRSVAAFIYEKFPSLSILRNHQSPLKNVLKRVKDILQRVGMSLDVSNSKSIYNSLRRLIAECGNTEAASVCLSQLISKPMMRAK